MAKLENNTTPQEPGGAVEVSAEKNPEIAARSASVDIGETDAIYVPDDQHDEWIDPRVRNYVVPLVAKTVPLHNDPT